MGAVRTCLGLVLLAFFMLLLGRLVLDAIQTFARDWRPRGPILLVAEAVYSVTDPPLLALRRVIPPLRIGRFAVDLAFLVLFFVTSLLMQIVS